MKSLFAVLLAVANLCIFSSSSMANTVYWTNWTSATPTTVTGQINIAGSIVDVTYSGQYIFAQTNNTGTNYWTNPTTYESPLVSNAPSTTDIIALYQGGLETITFSKPIVDPILALVSWNNNTVEFNTPIQILSYGPGFFGNGTPILNQTGTGFYGNGEVHGTIELPGTFSSITFSDTPEGWHGFTVGVLSEVTPPPDGVVPEPATMLLMGIGLAGGAFMRRRKQQLGV